MTLQEHYNLIIEGKATDKDVFLKNAKALFPQYIPNHYGFDLTAKILKQKSVLTEGYIDLGCGCSSKPPKKEDYELEFQKFLKESEEKSIKSDLKKTDKSVEDVQNRGYNSKDYKNIDNVIYDQLQRGVYTEMSEDPSQDLQAVKDKVLKNLAKDPIYYTKNSAFGIKNIGYTDKLPGANPSKTDQMTPVSKEKIKANIKDSLTKTESAKKGSKPKAVKNEMTLTPKNSKGVKKMNMPGKEKVIKLKEGMGLADLLNEDINENKSLKVGDIVTLKDDPSMDIKAGEYKVITIDSEYDEEDNIGEYEVDLKSLSTGDRIALALDYIEGKGYWKNAGVGVGKFSPKINEGHFENGWEYRISDRVKIDPQLTSDPLNKQGEEGSIVDYNEDEVTIEFDDDTTGKYQWGTFKSVEQDINEGPLEDADAKLAKDQAAKEAEAAAIEKQRADNKLKIANAKKNV